MCMYVSMVRICVVCGVSVCLSVVCVCLSVVCVCLSVCCVCVCLSVCCVHVYMCEKHVTVNVCLQFLGGRRTLPSTAANKPIAVSLDNMVMLCRIA